MQDKYQGAMKKISLSDEDKARILANVNHSYKKSQKKSQKEKVVPFYSRPRFSPRRIGTVAAACFVVVASAMLIRDQFMKGRWGTGSDMPNTPSTVSGVATEIWQELDSIDEIEKKTDCRTYNLGNLSKNYRVSKVEVANEQRHVRITYRHKKEKDKIIFEYKEGKHATEITDNFAGEREITTEKVGGSDVKMYGDKKCDGMTWEKESCTFGVKMMKARTTASAKKLVSGTTSVSSRKEDDHKTEESEEPDDKMNPNAVGWDGDEEATEEEQKEALREIFAELGFRVTAKKPAENIVYKMVDDCESFAFTYSSPGVLEDRRIIGYASHEDCPEGVMDDYEEEDYFFAKGVDITMYQKGKYDRLFVFSMEEVEITLLLDDYREEIEEDMLEMLLSVIHVSKEDEADSEPRETDKVKPQPTPSAASKAGVSAEPTNDIVQNND